MSRLLSDNLWTEIRSLATTKHPRVAAIAYVSSDDAVAFDQGDTLVTDATDETVGLGLTRARVLEAAFLRGAQLYSFPNLHAKVLVLGHTAVIGSCNLSAHSENVLTEAAWVTDQANAVGAARSFVQSLVPRSTPVDREFIARILRIPVRPRPRGPGQRPPSTRPDIVLMYFKQALLGDLKKYRRRSTTASTGKGAWDLRISPADVYRAPLQQILSHPGPRLDVTQGEVYGTTEVGIAHSTVELWPPTRRRRSELRLARWWSVDSWDIPEATFRAERAAGRRLFYVLELDAAGTAWARVLRESALNAEPRPVANHIRSRIRNTPARNAASGLVDLSTGQTLPV